MVRITDDVDRSSRRQHTKVKNNTRSDANFRSPTAPYLLPVQNKAATQDLTNCFRMGTTTSRGQLPIGTIFHSHQRGHLKLLGAGTIYIQRSLILFDPRLCRPLTRWARRSLQTNTQAVHGRKGCHHMSQTRNPDRQHHMSRQTTHDSSGK